MAVGPCYSWGLKAHISEEGCIGTEEELLPHSCVCHLCEPQRQDQLSCPVRIQASAAVNRAIGCSQELSPHITQHPCPNHSLLGRKHESLLPQPLPLAEDPE